MSPANKWDERYAEAGFAYGTEPNDFLVASQHLLPKNGSVLCLADGEGRNSVFLAEQGYRVTAVDSSSVGMKKAATLAREKGVQLSTYVADLADYPLPDNSFDAIISIFCHLPPPVRRQLHSRIASSLKKGGVFLLEGYTPRQLAYGTGGPPVEELLMNLDDLLAELQPLRIVHGAELEREVYEGRLHTGLGSVVQLVAVKE